MRIALDTRQFDAAMQRLVKEAMPAAIKEGMGKAASQLLNDAVMQSPTVPLDEGTLRGSAFVFVDGTPPRIPVSVPGKTRPKFVPAPSAAFGKEDKKTVAIVGFNTPYAARLHEGIGIKHWSEPGSGPKFLESKLANNRHEYIKIVADQIKSTSSK
jgi:hypothetical protein